MPSHLLTPIGPIEPRHGGPPRVLVVCRSATDSDRAERCAEQLEVVRRYIERCGCRLEDLDHEVIDALNSRALVEELHRRLREERWDLLIASELTRISRGTEELREVLLAATESGCSVIGVLDGFSTLLPEYRILAVVLALAIERREEAEAFINGRRCDLAEGSAPR